MRNDASEEEFKRLGDLLVKRGFVSASCYRDATKTVAFEFTPAGEELRRHLRRLFDVPAVHPMSLTPAEISSLIMVIMLTPPPNEVV